MRGFLFQLLIKARQAKVKGHKLRAGADRQKKNIIKTNKAKCEWKQSLTWTTTFRPVSVPIDTSVPGTLLLTVAGKTHTGMQNSSWLFRASASMAAPWKAWSSRAMAVRGVPGLHLPSQWAQMATPGMWQGGNQATGRELVYMGQQSPWEAWVGIWAGAGHATTIHVLLGASLSLVLIVPQEEDTNGRVKVVQSRQQSRHHAGGGGGERGAEVHHGLVIRWDTCSFLGITAEVGKENEVGLFKHKASPNTSLVQGGVWGGACGCKDDIKWLVSPMLSGVTAPPPNADRKRNMHFTLPAGLSQNPR